MGMIITDENFQQEVMDFKGLVLIDFWAEWCTPCKILEPIIAKLSEKYAGKENIKIGKLNVDDSPDTAMSYGVMSIPTMLFIKNGEIVDTIVGLRSESDIDSKISALI
jgi:thioredoxin 1